MGFPILFLTVVGMGTAAVSKSAAFIEARAYPIFGKVSGARVLFIFVVTVTVVACIVKAVYSARKKKKAKEREAAIGMNEIDQMDGHVFEQYVGNLLADLGFKEVTVTKGSGDQGVDVTASLGSVRYGIQCKRQAADVGNKAMQEVFAGLSLYGCSQGAVITNAYYTKAAVKLAEANSVILWDRDDLKKMISDRLKGIRYSQGKKGTFVKVKFPVTKIEG